MKAPAFWFKEKPGALSALFLPFAALWEAGGAARRAWAGRGGAYVSRLPLICVGNIVVGGAGKTPAALALAALLQDVGAHPVFVTRGYGGRLDGPLRVAPALHSAAEVGDEALLLAARAPTIMGRDRAAAVRMAEQIEGATHLIMDDGLQNPFVAPDLGILVVDTGVGLGNGRIIPAGPLRETAVQAWPRVGGVILVGQGAAPAGLPAGKPVFRARLVPGRPEGMAAGAEVLAFAGIGHPEKFFASCAQAGLRVLETVAFPDHHVFTRAQLEALRHRAGTRGARLVTTAKDAARLSPQDQRDIAVLSAPLVFEDPAALGAFLSGACKK